MKKNDQTLLERMRSAMQTLSPAERRVAMTLIADFPITGLKTVVEIAAASGVSPATVSRFAETLGYGNFAEFQRGLHADVVARFASPGALFETLPDQLSEGEGADAALKLFTQLVTDTMSATDPSEVEALVDQLADAKRTIYFVGGRQTGSLALYFRQLIHNLRAKTVHISGIDGAAVDLLADLDSRATLVAFDFRRYQQDTADFVAAAAARKAQIVLVTDPYMSPAVKNAHQVFVCHTRSGVPFDSFVSVLAFIDFICQQLFIRLGQDAHNRITRLEGIREAAGVEHLLRK
ncbi:RpiR family transcriptional regulator [Pandoraea sputorum]|nr:RpiR family transcriptional regulator [Pandoraea sputorum]